MPNNYTENYNLNQWEPGDQILRTDFKADNVRIDAALKVQANVHTALAFRVVALLAADQ